MFAVCGVKRVVAVLFLQVGCTVIVVCIEMQAVNLEFVSGTVLKALSIKVRRAFIYFESEIL